LTTQNIIDAALTLPETDRVRLVEELLDSLGPDAELPEGEFAAELHRRNAEIQQGAAELIPWSEIKRRQL
jgi:putative addiction module component (TIGR02574 family)